MGAQALAPRLLPCLWPPSVTPSGASSTKIGGNEETMRKKEEEEEAPMDDEALPSEGEAGTHVHIVRTGLLR